jgi:hypothetical protein
MSEKGSPFVYTYMSRGRERTVRFITYDQAFKRACDDYKGDRAYPCCIDNTDDPDDETGFVGTDELHKRIKTAMRTGTAAAGEEEPHAI